MNSEDVKKQRRWKLIITLLTFAALAILIYAVRSQIGDTIANLGKVNTWALLLMIPLQLWNYDAYTRLYCYVLRVLGSPIEYKPMYRVQLELNFVNHVFPSGGVSGFSYFGLRMRDFNVPASKSTLMQFVRFILIFVSFQALLLFGILSLAIAGNASKLMILIVGSIFTLLVVATILLWYILGSKQRIKDFSGSITKLINKLLHVVRPRHPETINVESVRKLFEDLHENYIVLKNNYHSLKKPLLYSFYANFTEILTVYVVYIAFGQWVNPGAVIIAYAIANFAGLVSFLPGGVGIFEALMTATLVAAGIPAGLSISVTVMYRVLNMAIQLIPGYFFYYGNLHKKTQNAA